MVDGDEGAGLTKRAVKLEELKLDEKHLSKIPALEEAMKRSDVIKRAIGNDSAIARVTAIADQIKLPFMELNERMENIRRATGMDSTLGRLTKQIDEQQKRIKSIDTDIPSYDLGRPEKYYAPPVERIKFPPNPILETNERLASIESRFDQMHAVAKEGAEIATGLQAAAAEFLQKFEMAASENDRAASGAIRIGRWAIVIAMAMPIVQVGLSLFLQEPDKNAEILAALEGMRSEINAMRDSQADAVDRLGENLHSVDGKAAAVLKEIEFLLKQAVGRSVQSSTVATPPE